MNDYRPDVLHTYGSYLGILFSYLAETGAPFHKPKVVTYSSDSLSDSTRRLIQDRFGIPVFSAYQANEALKIGFECEHHTGLHINIDLYPLRVVDLACHDLPVGETGYVVVSNLVNKGTVLLNYQIGDLAALLPQPCTCGRTLPLLSFRQAVATTSSTCRPAGHSSANGAHHFHHRRKGMAISDRPRHTYTFHGQSDRCTGGRQPGT